MKLGAYSWNNKYCRGLIHQTRDKSINKSQNNIDNYNTDQNIEGMINHAPTNWILMNR